MIKNLYHKHSIYTVVESIFKSVSSYISDFLKNLLFSVVKLLYSQSVFIFFSPKYARTAHYYWTRDPPKARKSDQNFL